MTHEQIAAKLKIFNNLDVVTVRSNALTNYQTTVLPKQWAPALTKASKPSEQLRHIYKDNKAPEYFSTLLANYVTAVNVIFDKETMKCLGLACMFTHVQAIGYGSDQSFWYASAPALTNDISKLESQLNSKIPGLLRNFLSMHDGFCINGNFGEGFLPLSKIMRLDDFAPEAGLDHLDLICIAGDGVGNQICMKIREDNNTVFDWDHEDQSLKPLGNFWEVATKFIGNSMGLNSD